MFHIVLWEPEIPPNTGNIARLCAATGTRLHLIGRLGFQLEDRHLKRAGLDYWPHVDLARHATFAEFLAAWDSPQGRIWCVDNPAGRAYTHADFCDGDALLFGSESKGLPPEIRGRLADHLIGIPMPTGHVRSLNLATAAAIVLYEALRQTHNW
ncbi:MAG: tRNA (cytidine(34)-2'-O)-methyltransferase [Bacteroidales bacterium]|nr:tRNA (cytidine(34)-2'-O)-methyltransferase [Bacteroidales bacterium]